MFEVKLIFTETTMFPATVLLHSTMKYKKKVSMKYLFKHADAMQRVVMIRNGAVYVRNKY